MREVYKNGHAKYWLPLLEYKFEGKGKLFGRDEFDEFLGGYSVRSPSLSSSFSYPVRLVKI
jgi:hypothetical protein